MKIALVDYAAEGTGAKSVLEDFYRHITKEDFDHEWWFFLSLIDLPGTERIHIVKWPEVKKGRLRRLWFDLMQGPKRIAAYAPDLVISLQNLTVIGYMGRQFVYVHHAIPFQDVKRFSFFKKDERGIAFYQYIYPFFLFPSIRKAEKVFVQTEWMKRKIIERVKIPPDNIVVIAPELHAGDIDCYKPQDGQLVGSRVFIFPAELLCYKNHSCIVAAAEELINRGILDFRVLFTLPEDTRERLGANGIEQIRLVSRLEQKDLFELYTKAVLIFPSYAESFGLPLLEGRRFGDIIFSSDTEVSREILAGYENAYFFDPFSPGDLADLMEKQLRGEIIYYDEEVPASRRRAESGWQGMLKYIEPGYKE